jgi:HK97 gp10 family phage protein
MSKVKKIDLSTFNNKVEKAMFRCALLVQNKAKNNAPVKTGRLKANIVLEPDGAGYIVGTNNIPYAKYVEFGTASMVAAHGEHDPENPVTDWDAKRKRGGVGQTLPFLRNALFEKKFEFAKIFKEEFL